jgi:hypothetical protein
MSSVSGAYAGLFSSPFAVLLMLLESNHIQKLTYYGTLLIAGLAAVVGFGLFYALDGLNFSSYTRNFITTGLRFKALAFGIECCIWYFSCSFCFDLCDLD